MLQQFIDEVDVGVRHPIALVPSLSGSEVGQLSSFPSLSLPGKFSSVALACSANAACNKEQGPFACSYILKSA